VGAGWSNTQSASDLLRIQRFAVKGERDIHLVDRTADFGQDLVLFDPAERHHFGSV